MNYCSKHKIFCFKHNNSNSIKKNKINIKINSLIKI